MQSHKTNDVRSPAGSTSRAIFKASELAKSELAGETARMIEFGFSMYLGNGKKKREQRENIYIYVYEGEGSQTRGSARVE